MLLKSWSPSKNSVIPVKAEIQYGSSESGFRLSPGCRYVGFMISKGLAKHYTTSACGCFCHFAHPNARTSPTDFRYRSLPDNVQPASRSFSMLLRGGRSRSDRFGRVVFALVDHYHAY